LQIHLLVGLWQVPIFTGEFHNFFLACKTEFSTVFLEPYFKGQRSGWIEVVCGCMFSGKTEELIRRLKRARIASMKVEVFKPRIDTRYDESAIVSHDTTSVLAIPVDHSSKLLKVSDDTTVVGIDEAQFFDMELPGVCQELALRGIRVIAAGLDMDYRGVPFGPMPNLLAISEYVTKVHAICVHCGNLATHSYRLAEGDSVVLLGEKEQYEPRCRSCYHQGNILRLI
jgi:thymidine kinase